MSQSADYRSGKGHRDENFPVASHLVSARHRPIIMAFYDFARAADDIADHATLTPDEKFVQLDRLEASLTGTGADDPTGLRLRAALMDCNLPPRHALDLLKAFRQDVTKTRYADWDELIGYCTYSAMPVGRFVLDVHGEDVSTWAASDVLCTVLQIINHTQDCGKDYRNLDRVYIPQDMLAAAGATTAMLGAAYATPQLLNCLHRLTDRTQVYFDASPSLAGEIKDTRLACEVAAIDALARKLLAILKQGDPLKDKVHLGKGAMLATMITAVAGTLVRRVGSGSTMQRGSQGARP
ncbi:squalene synthase HpnC [Pseudorhodoplanes sinuspersici]|uniref:Squalene synthase HpnC n=1 Tax=Pseudorhodoplanes sinuspersici TaxID=1235591 RepID=A0A1W6ZMF3_9HYPH|nr:squalene synthase HpnC [Pseudorhodoplanes sinuspersici]ARP98427.1 squalene synthase HpnC [Pseudorhodoplanes sinuspersici]RKE66097.1 squalene synthase HpnC [Pseudorhodoplanes sinuspersici]